MSEPLPSSRTTTTTKPQQHRKKRILGLRLASALVALVVVSVVSTSKLVFQSLSSSWPDPYDDAPMLLSKAEGEEEEEATTMTSPICNPSFDNVKNNTDQRRIERIVFIHMRKAGGSTLRGYLRKVSQKLGLEYIVHEGSIMPRKFLLPPPPSSSSSSRYSTLDKSGTFYVTHVRDPMQRTISHYKYEGRWPCHKLVAAGNNNTSWTPTKKNARSFETFVNKTLKEAEQKKFRPNIWSCALNCHLQWLNILNKKETLQLVNVSHVRYSEAYNHALKLAMEFDLIIDSDRLFRDEHYGEQIETFFGGFTGLVGNNRRMYCQVQSQKANALHPATISNATWLDIRTRNQPDYDLMEALRGPCADEKVAIEFPSGVSLKDYAVASSQKDDKGKEKIERVSIPEDEDDDEDDDDDEKDDDYDDDDDFDFPSKVEEVARRGREAFLARRREDKIRRESGSPLKDNVGDDDDNDDDDEDDGDVEDGEEEKDDDDDALDGEYDEDREDNKDVDDDDKDIDNDV